MVLRLIWPFNPVAEYDNPMLTMWLAPSLLAALPWLQIGVLKLSLTPLGPGSAGNPESTPALNEFGSVCLQRGDLSRTLG